MAMRESGIITAVFAVFVSVSITNACVDKFPACHRISHGQCYNAFNLAICCKSCLKLKKGLFKPGCAYGDRYVNCRFLTPRQCYKPYLQTVCCETCNAFMVALNGTKGCEYGDRSPACGNLNSDQCYQYRNSHICCRNCAKYKTNIPGCEFGDRRVVFRNEFGRFNCRTYVKMFGPRFSCAGDNFKKLCCETCNRYLKRTLKFNKVT